MTSDGILTDFSRSQGDKIVLRFEENDSYADEASYTGSETGIFRFVGTLIPNKYLDVSYETVEIYQDQFNKIVSVLTALESGAPVYQTITLENYASGFLASDFIFV